MNRQHPLWNINFKHANRNADRGPMAKAVDLRAKLGELGYTVLIMDCKHLLISTPEHSRRFVGYHIDQAERLLEKLYE
jgi:hypothetical protein